MSENECIFQVRRARAVYCGLANVKSLAMPLAKPHLECIIEKCPMYQTWTLLKEKT